MRWRDFGGGEKVLIVVVGVWWVLGAWAAVALGFHNPMAIVGMPFVAGFVFIAILQVFTWLLRRLGH
jgi:hypothetical protein